MGNISQEPIANKETVILTSSTNAKRVINIGSSVPYHDQEVIDESAAPATTTITYKLSGVTVGTKTITVSGTTTTITVA